MGALRLFRGDDDVSAVRLGSELPAEARLTLREYYEQKMLEQRQIRKVAPKSIESDFVCLRRWEQWGTARPKVWKQDTWGKPRSEVLQGEPISNPPIGLVTDEDLTDFVKALARKYSVKTVQTTVRTLSVIFSHAGPQGPRHRHSQDVLLRCPAFPSITVPIQRKFIPQATMISKLLHGSSLLRSQWQPLGRALVLMLAGLGIRPRDVCELTPTAFDTAVGELSWVAAKTEKHKPYPVVCPLPLPLRTALEQLLQSPVSQERLLCCYPLARRVWEAILEHAQLTETKQDQRGREYFVCSMASLRKSCNTRLNAIRPGAGDWVLGHAVGDQSKVNHEHYSECYNAPDWVRAALLSPEFAAFLGHVEQPADAVSVTTPAD